MGIQVTPRFFPPVKISVTQPSPLSDVVGTIVSKVGTVTGTAGVGSSLFLQRLVIPAAMSITEIQAAMSISFPVTSQGAGTLSRTFGIYSFGNSTSLALLYTASGTSAWATGTSTAGASGSLTQFQGGWSSPLIQPMTFASSSITAGEYVVGQLFDFAQASSTWTINFYGAQANSLTSASLGALSSGGLAGVSAFTASGSGVALSNSGTLQVNAYELSSNTFVGSAASAIATATAISTKSFSIQSRTAFTGTTAINVLSSTGLSAGSFVATSGSLAAVTAAGTAASLPNFGFIGQGSTTSGFPTVFSNGIMSTGAMPSSIAVTSTAVTYSGSVAFQIPWFALAGN